MPRAAARPVARSTFKDGSTILGTGTLDASGVASFTISTLGWRTALDHGGLRRRRQLRDQHLRHVSQVVNQKPRRTTTAVTSSANPSVFGQAVTFTATVTADLGRRHAHRDGRPSTTARRRWAP